MAGNVLGLRNAQIVMSSIHQSLKSTFSTDLETLHIKYKKKGSYREAKEKETDKFITPEITYAAITRPRNIRYQSTITNKITQ